MRLKPETCMRLVCERHGIRTEELMQRDPVFGSLKHGRDNYLTRAREDAVIMLRRNTDWSTTDIAQYMGYKSHSPVVRALKHRKETSNGRTDADPREGQTPCRIAD